MTNLHFWYCKPNSYKCGKVVTTPICKYKCLPLQCQRSHICFSLLHVQLDYCVKQLEEKMSVSTQPLLFCTFPKANKQIVNCPTSWSLFFIFVFLCWSSTNTGWSKKTVTCNFFLADLKVIKNGITQTFLKRVHREVLIFWYHNRVRWKKNHPH